MLDSKLRILASAKVLFLSHGYTGTTVDAICAEAKLTKGSFYHFFKSKEELGLAVVNWSVETTGAVLMNGPWTGVADPVERAFAYLDHFAASSQVLWKNGCLLGIFAMELSDTNPRVQAAISEIFHAISVDFARIIEPILAACPPGSFPPPAALGDQFFGALEGAIILAKAHRQPQRIEQTIRDFSDSLRARLPLAA